MDEMIRYLGTYQRRYPGAVPVLAAGWLPGKRRVTSRLCGSCNVQFVIRGSGELDWDGQTVVGFLMAAFVDIENHEVAAFMDGKISGEVKGVVRTVDLSARRIIAVGV
jgi:hypothetical protein